MAEPTDGRKEKNRFRFTPTLFILLVVPFFHTFFPSVGKAFTQLAYADTIGSSETTEDAQLNMASASLLGVIPSVFGGALREPVANGKFKLEDLEKVVFLLPGDPNYQPENAYNYFAIVDRQGERGKKIIDIYLKYGYFVQPMFLQTLTGKENTKLSFNLMRFETKRYIDDILFAVIPNVLSVVCERGYYGIKIYEPPAGIKIAKDNSQLIKAPDDFKPREAKDGIWRHICIKNGAQWDLFISMSGRLKIKGRDQWQIR